MDDHTKPPTPGLFPSKLPEKKREEPKRPASRDRGLADL